MVSAHKVSTDQQPLGEGLDRIQGRIKQLSARVHAQAERSTHEFDALRAELESVLEQMRVAKQQVRPSMRCHHVFCLRVYMWQCFIRMCQHTGAGD